MNVIGLGRALGLALTLSISAHAQAAELAAHEAPFGLRFGMSLSEVSFPVLAPPARPSDLVWGREEHLARETFDTMVTFCELSFDSPMGMNFEDEEWHTWAYMHLRDELQDLAPNWILDKQYRERFERMEEQVSQFAVPEPEDFRTVSVRMATIGGRERTLCLLFTRDGLSHVYVPQSDLSDVVDAIYGKLDAAGHRAHAAKLYISKVADGYRVAQRNSWYDRDRNILVLASRHTVESGPTSWITTAFMDEEDFWTPPYIAYTDLSRRELAYRRYRDSTLPILIQAIEAAVAEETRTIEAERERQRERAAEVDSGRQELIESFQ